MKHVFLGFRNGKLITVVESLEAEAKNAIAVDYWVGDVEGAGKQIAEWKSEKR